MCCGEVWLHGERMWLQGEECVVGGCDFRVQGVNTEVKKFDSRKLREFQDYVSCTD